MTFLKVFVLSISVFLPIAFAQAYSGKSQFRVIPQNSFDFAASLTNTNQKISYASENAQYDSEVVGMSQNFKVSYGLFAGHNISLSTDYMNVQSTTKVQTNEIKSLDRGLGNLNFGYLGAIDISDVDVFYGLNYSFKHQERRTRMINLYESETNAVSAQNSWTPSIGVAIPTSSGISFGGRFSYTFKMDGQELVEESEYLTTTKTVKNGNSNTILAFVEFDNEYLPFLSVAKTTVSNTEYRTETAFENSFNGYSADTVTFGIYVPIAARFRLEPRVSHTQYHFEDQPDLKIEQASQTSLNVGLTILL